MRSRRWFPVAVLTLLVVAFQCKEPDPEPEDPGNTETGETLDPEDVVEVGIRPTRMRIDNTTALDLKGHAITRDGGFYDTLGGSWNSTNPEVATIDENGHLLPVANGEVLIEYEWEGVTAEPATIEIVDPGRIEVTVVDLATGEPIADASVAVSQDGPLLAVGTTDADGFATLEGPFAGPVTLTAWGSDDHRYGSLAQVAPREARLPLFPKAEGFGQGRIAGTVGFEGANTGDIAIAMAIPSVSTNPLSIGAKDLLGKNRSLEGFGLNWTLPENVQINGIVDSWEGDVMPGKRVVFAAGGVYDLGIALELALNLETYGTGSLFPTMTQHIERLRFGVSEVMDVEPGAELQGVDFEMTTELPLESWVDLAPPPPGYYFPDPVLVLSWREYLDAGHVAVGFGTGKHPYIPEGDPPEDDDDDDDATWTFVGGQLDERMWIPVREAARDGVFEDVPTRHFAFAWENGVDYGTRATGVISAPTTKDRIRLPDFLEPCDTFEPEPGSWTFEWAPPEGTDMTWLGTRPRCSSGDTDSWHVFGPGLDSFRYPQGLPLIYTDDCAAAGGPGTTFYPEILSLEKVSYQSLVNAHDEAIGDFWDWVNRRTYSSEWAPEAAFP
ncbi:MAG: hypothetical protein QGH45_24830 [Myxococcota bacterium]|nr:hypothetical protein [Myxococcota bacterium]